MNEKIKKKPSPTRIIIGSFALIILIGALLLMLPFSSAKGECTSPVDAFFTATTATCVTGLVTVDTFSHWSTFGHGVILALIQIGGLGLITLTTFFLVSLRKKAGLSNMVLAREAVGSNDISSLKGLVMLVIIFSFTVELIGAALLSIRFVPMFGIGKGIWISVFTAISAYCNAGIDLFGQISPFSSLTTFDNDPLINLTVMALIIIGGLGFIVYYDLLFSRKRRGHFMLHTRIVLIATLVLVLSGLVLFLLFEWGNNATLGSFDTAGQKTLAAAFHSVSTRTAGFNTVSIADLTAPSKLLTVVYMFIGAAPGSTAGGVKVTTVVVIMAAVIATLKGSDDVVIMNRKISQGVIYKAISLVLIGLLIAVISTAVVYTTNDVSLLDASLETVSALGTVGLSTGITPSLSLVSKIVIMLTMFLGRVGPFTFFIAFSAKADKNKVVVLPEGEIIVG